MLSLGTMETNATSRLGRIGKLDLPPPLVRRAVSVAVSAPIAEQAAEEATRNAEVKAPTNGHLRHSATQLATNAAMPMSQHAAVGPIQTLKVRKVIADTASRSLLLRILVGAGVWRVASMGVRMTSSVYPF